MGAHRETYMAQQIERDSITDYELFAENIPAYNLFQEVQTQFRYVAGQKLIPTGLDYSGVEAHLNILYEQDDIPDLMKDLQVIERAYLKAMHD